MRILNKKRVEYRVLIVWEIEKKRSIRRDGEEIEISNRSYKNIVGYCEKYRKVYNYF